MNITKDERITRHKRFLAANWQLLASFAWEFYQQQGRGAVVVDENDFVHANVPQFAALKFRYMADNSSLLKEVGGWPGEKEANWVKTYDPDARVIVMILRDRGGTSGYLIGTAPKPFVAFANQQAKNN